MSKWAISGILCCVIGGVMVLFRVLGGVMGTSDGGPALAIVDMVSPESLNWIDGMTFMHLDGLLNTIVLAPVYILLFIVGVVLLIISGFLK